MPTWLSLRAGPAWQLCLVVTLAASACTQEASSPPVDPPPPTSSAASTLSSTSTSVVLEPVDDGDAAPPARPFDASACDVADQADGDNTWTVVSDGECGLALNSAPAVWTGTELVVWGGELESETEWTSVGGAYDPASNTWRSLAASPLSQMSGHVMIMVGSDIFICCGLNRSGGQAEAALYNPERDEWTEVAKPPPGENRVTAVWTGEEVLIPQRSARYNPTTDEWSRLPRAPRSILPSAKALWTGEQVVVWSSNHSNDHFLLYDPAENQWSELPSQPSDARAWHGSMVWTGEEVVVWGDRINTSGQSIGWKMRLGERVWEPIADAPGEAASWWEGTPGSNSGIWSGDRMLVWAGELLEADDQTTVVLSYDPSADRWTELDSAPSRSYTPELLWTGSQLLVVADPVMSMTP